MWDHDRVQQYIEMLNERKNYEEPRIAGIMGKMEKLEKMLEEFQHLRAFFSGRKDKQHIGENKQFSHFKNNSKKFSNRRRISDYCRKMRHEYEGCWLRTKLCTLCTSESKLLSKTLKLKH